MGKAKEQVVEAFVKADRAMVSQLDSCFAGIADAIEALIRETVREEMDLQALRMEQSARVVEVQELQRSEGHVAEPPADKLTRDRSTPENAAWWDAIVEAAKSAPRITVAEPPVLMCEWCGATKAENCCQHMYNEPPAGVHEKLSALRPEDLLSSEQRIEGDRVLREMQRARSVKYAVECPNCFGRGCSRCHGIGLETAEPPAGGQRRCNHKEPDMDCFLCRHEALSEPQPSAEAQLDKLQWVDEAVARLRVSLEARASAGAEEFTATQHMTPTSCDRLPATPSAEAEGVKCNCLDFPHAPTCPRGVQYVKPEPPTPPSVTQDLTPTACDRFPATPPSAGPIGLHEDFLRSCEKRQSSDMQALVSEIRRLRALRADLERASEKIEKQNAALLRVYTLEDENNALKADLERVRAQRNACERALAERDGQRRNDG